MRGRAASDISKVGKEHDDFFPWEEITNGGVDEGSVHFINWLNIIVC